jgi:hypothetical protein
MPASLMEAPGEGKKARTAPRERPERAAADAMTGNQDARRMIWQVLEDSGARPFFSALDALGWRRARVGVYDLLWHGDEWRLVSQPQGSGVGRSLEAVFSLFEPLSKEAQRLYGWRAKADSDRPSQEFVDWAAGSRRNLQRFANALPRYVSARIEPVSAMGSNPSAVDARTAKGQAPALPRLTFERDGSFELSSRGETLARGRITVDTGQVAFDDDRVDPDDEDWMGAGTPARARGFRQGMRRVGGKVTGDGSLSRALEALAHADAPGTRGGSRAYWSQVDELVVASSSTSPGESRAPHARVRSTPTMDDMANTWAASQTPVPPGVWKVAELRKVLRMIARETGARL